MRTEFFKFYDNVAAAAPAYGESGGDFIFILKIISVIVSILLLAGCIFLIFKLKKGISQSLEMATEEVSAPGLTKKVSDERWESIVEKLELEDESSWKLAVIEADKFFDDILKRTGYQGEDMGERLKQITPAQLSNIEEVWQAHKMRNNIVHDSDFETKKGQARRAIEIYQKALEDLEIL